MQGPQKNTGKRKSTGDADVLGGKKQKTNPRGNAEQQKSENKKNRHHPTTTDLMNIHLENEDCGSVPIYDTCDDIRQKMNDHLRKMPNANQSSFARQLSAIARASV